MLTYLVEGLQDGPAESEGLEAFFVMMMVQGIGCCCEGAAWPQVPPKRGLPHRRGGGSRRCSAGGGKPRGGGRDDPRDLPSDIQPPPSHPRPRRRRRRPHALQTGQCHCIQCTPSQLSFLFFFRGGSKTFFGTLCRRETLPSFRRYQGVLCYRRGLICNDIDRTLCAPCRTGQVPQQGRHYSRIHNIPEAIANRKQQKVQQSTTWRSARRRRSRGEGGHWDGGARARSRLGIHHHERERGAAARCAVPTPEPGGADAKPAAEHQNQGNEGTPSCSAEHTRTEQVREEEKN